MRDLAAQLDISPATVAAAYRTLRLRGLIGGDGRRGTHVTLQPPLRIRPAQPLPPNTRDLASGNPDAALLPPLEPAFGRLSHEHKLYGGPNKLERLVELARADFGADGVDGDIAIVGGALDGVERVLEAELRAGDRVVVEDPSWPRIHDLLLALRLEPDPVAIDDKALVPDALERALAAGARAVIATPRGQNPTAAAVDGDRGERLRHVLERHPDVFVVEDDYVGAVAGAPYVELHSKSPRWVVIRSLSKVLGPDLRVAPMAGDPLTISRVEGRQLLGAGWVSHILQQTAAELWRAATPKLLPRTSTLYAERRAALVNALAVRGIRAHGGSGFGVWVPLAEEVTVVQHLLERGWAVSAGERYRFRTPSGIRITTTDLEPKEATQVAAAVAEALAGGAATYSG